MKYFYNTFIKAQKILFNSSVFFRLFFLTHYLSLNKAF